MATRTRSRRSAPRARNAPVGDRVKDSALRGLSSWARFTWATDTHRVFGLRFLPHAALNWLVTMSLVVGWVTRWSAWWKLLAVVTVAGVLYTVARAARHLPARRKTLEAMFVGTKTVFKHPTATLDPAERVHITSWGGPGRPAAGAVLFDPSSAAGQPSGRGGAERAVEQVLTRHLGDNEQVVFEHAPDSVQFEVVQAGDTRLVRQGTRRWIETVAHQLFPTRRGQESTTVDVVFADATEDGRVDVPSTVTIGTGGSDTSSARFREEVEKTFDARVDRGVVFVYEWGPGVLTISAVEPGSPAAARKIAARKISDTTVGAVQTVSRAAHKGCTVEVLRWIPEEADHGANTPLVIRVGLGTADFSATWDQHRLERSLDRALEQVWPDRVWLPQWTFGADTVIELGAVPARDERALQKRELTRLRQVVADKFPATRGKEPPDVLVHEWTTVRVVEDGGAAIVARAKEATVTFGTVDVSQPETRQAFEAHFDSITESNDWRYEWESAKGRVNVTAVPTLPSFVPFPEPGTKEFDEWNLAFRKGVIHIGPAKGGYRTAIDLNKSPHVLTGGATGKGKSVLLTLFLFGALNNPDLYELVVIDPKVTDFTWVGGYPSVLTYAPTDARDSTEQVQQAVQVAFERMQSRQNLLGMLPVKDLPAMRSAIARGELTSISLEDVPKRLLVFFDEGGAFFTPSKDADTKAVQDACRTDMERIGMLGRAMEINIIMAAQKPSEKNIGTAMRAQLVNRIAVGALNTDTSRQVLDNNLAAQLLNDGSPKGRGVFVDDARNELVFQCYYLPEADEEIPAHIATPDNPDGPPVKITGIRTRVADRLKAGGWERVTKTVEMTRIPEAGPDKGNPVSFDVEQEEWIHPSRIEP